MVIDTSALAAILFGEPEAAIFERSIEEDEERLTSAANVLELSIVCAQRYPSANSVVDRLIAALGLEIVPVDLTQLEFALEAFDRFGRGRHPAGLNFGDCFTYALARASGQPLLFKGQDFARTDLRLVATP